jgi:hypothetical protein
VAWSATYGILAGVIMAAAAEMDEVVISVEELAVHA